MKLTSLKSILCFVLLVSFSLHTSLFGATYTDKTAFEAALTDVTTIDFEGIAPGGGQANAVDLDGDEFTGITLTEGTGASGLFVGIPDPLIPGGNNFNFFAADFFPTSGDACLSPDLTGSPVGAVVVDFDSPVGGVGAYFLDVEGGGASIEAFDGPGGTGSSLGILVLGNQGDNSQAFAGITAAGNNISSAVLDMGGGGDGVGMDDLTYGTLPADIEKDMVDEGELGDQITITLNVDNPYGEAIKVEDVLPDGLAYIPDIDAAPGNQNLKIDGSYVDPTTVTIEDNTISVEVGPGPHTITFVVQVVEVQCDEVDVTNVANVYNPEDDLDDSDDVEITLYPYEDFVKEVEVVYEAIDDDIITVGELVQWDMTITLPNNFAWNITNAVLKDNLGGNLGMADDDVDNDKDGGVDEGGPGDLPAGYNTIPSGTLSYETKGKTKKVQLEITGISVGIGGSLDFVLGIFTDCNPGKGKNAPHQEYTSPGDYELNSGATVKFIDPATGLQLSAHTCPITVTAYPPPVLP